MESGEQDLNIESDEDEIITSFENLLLQTPINTTSELKRLMLKVNSKLSSDLKEKFLENLKELIRVSSLLKNDKCEAISYEEYKEMCKGCIVEDDGMEIFCFEIHKDNELMKKLSNYSVDKLDCLDIFLKSEWKNEQLNIRKFLKSFGSTKIKKFYFGGHTIQTKDQESSRNNGRSDIITVFPCSSVFLELRHAVCRIKDNITINFVELKCKEFCQLVRASIQVFELEFWNCKILTETKFDFGQMEGCKIQELQIDYSFQVYDSRRDSEIIMMKIFVAIIHCSNLMRSLKRLSFRCNDKMKNSLLEKAKEELNDVDYRWIKQILETYKNDFEYD